jgi:hypothetical protein
MKDDCNQPNTSFVEKYVPNPALTPGEQILAASRHYEKYKTKKEREFDEIFSKIMTAMTAAELLAAENEAKKHEGGFALVDFISERRQTIAKSDEAATGGEAGAD